VLADEPDVNYTTCMSHGPHALLSNMVLLLLLVYSFGGMVDMCFMFYVLSRVC